MDVLARALQRAGSKTTVAVQQGDVRIPYSQLLRGAKDLQQLFCVNMRPVINTDHPPRVGIMCEPGPMFVMGMWSAWLSGSIFVPYAPSHPSGLLDYELHDSRPSVVR
jgi:acyl-CoA synthetase (AMP-forming)/AMP-acid ligase II